MGFGVLMMVDGKLDEQLAGYLTEVRVEQHLDEPTNFAVRFSDDLCEGQPEVLDLLGLNQVARPGRDRLITLVAMVADKPRCLVHGVIEKLQGAVVKGGPGSWVEVRGRDRRVQLDRDCLKRKHSGRANEVVAELLRRAEFEPDVAETPKAYDDKQQTLNHQGSSLELVDKIARTHGLSFWIEATVDLAARPPRVKEIARVKASPPRADEQGKKLAISAVTLAPSVQPHLVLVAGKGEHTNVAHLELDVDWNRVTEGQARAIDETSGSEQTLSGVVSQSPLGKGGSFLRDVAPAKQACAEGAGDPIELQRKLEAALDAEAWFVKATASTTLHMLGDVLYPHDIVCLTGMGRLHSGAYQVKQVTHVINAAEHYMDVELRRNTIGGGDECAKKT